MTSPAFHLRFNLVGVAVWLLLLAPTLLFWQNSLTYVVFMSWYANFVGHISAAVAALVGVKTEEA